MFILEWSVIVSPGAPVVVINMEIRCRQGEGGLHLLLPDMRMNIRVKLPMEDSIGRDLVNSVFVFGCQFETFFISTGSVVLRQRDLFGNLSDHDSSPPTVQLIQPFKSPA